jgi:hypothetical protein
MMNTIFRKSFDVKINSKSVLKRMGVRKRQDEWLSVVNRVCDEYGSRIRPRGIYRETFSRPNGRTIDIGNGVQLESVFLTRALSKPQKAAIFLVTIGSELEQGIREKIDSGQNRTAYILDCLGSNAAESTAAAIHKEVQERLGTRMSRYSPGYNDWDISQQETLFDFLGDDMARELGVDLTSDFMMTPRKSVSGIILPKRE